MDASAEMFAVLRKISMREKVKSLRDWYAFSALAWESVNITLQETVPP
jgi:hypothetical protein